MLAENLARAMENDFLGGEEIIVTDEHEGAMPILPQSALD